MSADAPTPLDLDAIRVLCADVDNMTEEIKRLRAEVVYLRREGDSMSEGNARLLAEVDRLRDRPAPAWDEEAITAAIRAAAGHVLTNVSNYPDAARATLLGGDLSVVITKTTEAVLAVIREHLPVTPSREEVAHLLFRAAGRDDWGVANELERDEWLDVADVALSLLPGRLEATVKAEGIREAADAWHAKNQGNRPGPYLFLWNYAARLAAEGGADRG